MTKPPYEPPTVGVRDATPEELEAARPKLYEVEHDYYCSTTNYFGGARSFTNHFESWRAFVNAEGDADEDYNLVFRWDWRPQTDEDGEELENEWELQICWMTQRKGYYRCTLVKVTKDDEPEIRKWLLARFHHLLQLWRPLMPADIPAGATYASLNAEVADLGLVETMTDRAGNERRERVSGRELARTPGVSVEDCGMVAVEGTENDDD